MLNKSKPYLGGIQEFGTAAYVKGYRIYWPSKRSISVESNVVFNENDILEKENTTVMVGVQSKGENEKEKVIQHPENVNEVKNQTEKEDKPIPTKTTNSVCFPSSPEPETQAESEEDDEVQQYR